jgi:hypothetical protein
VHPIAMKLIPARSFFTFLAGLLFAFLSAAQVNLTTERYDNSRLGANLSETQLNTSNVSASTFGKLWSYTVSGSVQAQPLYVQNVAIAGKGTHNVLYVVTMNDVVYAFDADSSSDTPLLSLDLTTQVAGSTPVPITDIVGPGLNVVGNVGIESTPVIDLTTNTIYLVARTKETAATCAPVNGNYCQRLHALDITSFAEKFGGPVVLQGSVAGSGNASSGGTLVFDPKIHNQRSSLALANGQIFIGWASHEDQNPYHGWVMMYNSATLAQTGIWCSTPDGAMGGVWMSGRAPAVDSSGNVYYIVGNGDWDGKRQFGESLVKFGSTSGMPLLDWFTPDTYNSLNAGDVDYGSSGPILIPGTDLVSGAGKASIFYTMHKGNLGHEVTGNTQIVQSLNNNGGEVKGGPVYWNRSGGVGPWMYVWSNGCDYLKAYHFNGSTFDTAVVSQSTIASPCGASGGVLTLSANGSTAGTGIIWSSMPLADDGDHGVHQGVLRALNADDLTKELWNSNNSAQDNAGNWPKYAAPTVVNGRVYLPSFPSDGVSSAPLNVYGLLPSTPDFSLSVSPASHGVNPGGSVNYTISTASVFGFSGTVALAASGLPNGATASFAPSSVVTPGTSTLTIATSTGTPLGNVTITVTGTSGTRTHSINTVLVVTTVSPGHGAISIDFVGRGTPMAPSETAGVVAKANWNEAQGSTSSGFALSDETGTATGVVLSWTSSPVWSLPITDAPGNVRMMLGYLDTVGQNTTVTVSGLPSNPAGYDVYVYADGDNGGATRTGTYQLSGTGITTTSVNLTDSANTNYSGTFTQANGSAGNYLIFPGIGVSGFTLTAIPSTATDGTQRAPVNGMQIVPRAPAADFTWSVSPASQTVTAGNPSSFALTAIAQNGFSGTITPSVSGVPSGATGAFSPATLSGSGTSTLTINTASGTTAGTATLTITGASGSLSHSASATLTVNAQAAAATPVFSPAGGTYSTPQSVTISDATSGATIYYTLDGSTPSTGSSKYAGPIAVSAATTVKAIAAASGFANSSVGAATYTITLSFISKAGWSLKYADSQETVGENGAATNSFDGKTNTFWHSQWYSANPPPPHEIQINLGATYTLSGFTYLPRQDGCSHGDIKQYEFYVSTDGVNWGTAVASGNFNYGTYTYNCPGGTVFSPRVIKFTTPVKAAYIRLRALSELGGNPWTSAAEISVYK